MFRNRYVPLVGKFLCDEGSVEVACAVRFTLIIAKYIEVLHQVCRGLNICEFVQWGLVGQCSSRVLPVGPSHAEWSMICSKVAVVVFCVT